MSIKTTAIYPGTFDPITLGHQNIITRSTKFCHTLYIGVAVAHHKKPLFNIEERRDMVQSVLDDIQADCEIKVVIYDGLLVDLCHQLDINLIIRGIRGINDFEYESQLAATNRHLDENIDTIFLPPVEQYSFVSSTVVKEIAFLGGDVSRLLPPKVKEKLINKIYQN